MNFIQTQTCLDYAYLYKLMTHFISTQIHAMFLYYDKGLDFHRSKKGHGVWYNLSQMLAYSIYFFLVLSNLYWFKQSVSFGLVPLKGTYAVGFAMVGSCWKLKVTLRRMCNIHNSTCLWCILGLIELHVCAVIGNNPRHKSKISSSMPSLSAT